jgi:hypothetical protein
VEELQQLLESSKELPAVLVVCWKLSTLRKCPAESIATRLMEMEGDEPSWPIALPTDPSIRGLVLLMKFPVGMRNFRNANHSINLYAIARNSASWTKRERYAAPARQRVCGDG